jgi:hypothetical protein
MAQSRRGVIQILEAQVHPLVVAIARFIQLMALLPLLKPMAQSRRGALHMLEAQVRLLAEGAPVPPVSELPHAVIEPLVLRAAKVPSVE